MTDSASYEIRMIASDMKAAHQRGHIAPSSSSGFAAPTLRYGATRDNAVAMRLYASKTLSGNLARLPDKVLVAKGPSRAERSSLASVSE